MRASLTAFAAGVLVGCLYAVLRVRSPAPPVVALVGLLGILLGEQLPPLARRALWGAAPKHLAGAERRHSPRPGSAAPHAVISAGPTRR